MASRHEARLRCAKQRAFRARLALPAQQVGASVDDVDPEQRRGRCPIPAGPRGAEGPPHGRLPRRVRPQGALRRAARPQKISRRENHQPEEGHPFRKFRVCDGFGNAPTRNNAS